MVRLRWILLLVLGACSACESPGDPDEPAEWVSLPDMPVAVRAPAVAAGDDRLFVIGGTSGSQRVDNLQIFEVSSSSWGEGAPLPVASDWGAAVYLDGKVHFLGGVTDQAAATQQHWVYSLEADEWMAGAALPFASAGSAIAAIGSTILLAGGIDGPSAHAAHLQIGIDGGSSWNSGADLPGPRINLTGAATGSGMYVAGGGTPGLGTTADFLEYRLSSDDWLELPPLRLAREAHGTAATGEWVCVVGGRAAASGNLNTPFDDTSCYSTGTQTWSEMMPLPRARQEVELVSLGSDLYAVGGRDELGAPVPDVTRLTVR